MPVITISRLTGSGGATIGQQIADSLGASYLNTQIIQEVAQRLRVPEATAKAYDERAEAFIERLSRVLWLASPGMVPMGSSETPLLYESTTQAFVEVTRQIIREAAQTGNVVIFGHGAQFILAQQPRVLHVRFIAPLVYRVERVVQRDKITRAEAERRVREEDHRRANSIRQFYDADWNAPDPFHLIINTARWNQETCVRLVLNAVEELARQPHRNDSMQPPSDTP